AVQNRFLLGETAQMTITKRDLIQRVDIARIEIHGALQATHRLFLFALATLDVTLELEYPRVIGQGLGGYLQFRQSGVIIQVASIKILSAGQVRFTRIRIEPECLLDSRFGQCQPGRGVVVTVEVKEVVRRSEQAIRFEK